MAARSIGSATISFGLVSIPVRLYVATSSEQLSFNQLHTECGARVRQQLWCPRCERVVERGELVKGYEFAKNQWVRFTDEELKKLEAEQSHAIDIHEFVPLAAVDPIFFARSQYLGPDRGAEKAYHLLAQAMRETERVALAQHVHHGKEHLVLVRPHGRGLVLHAMHYADEVRSFEDVETGGEPKIRAGEAELARKLVDQLSVKTFEPEKYRDAYRDRLQEVVEQKVAGEEVTVGEPPAERAQVIDLMEALKKSLAGEGRRGRQTTASASETTTRRRQAAAARRREPVTPRRRSQKR